MPKFPRDALKQRVVNSLESLGFRVVREQEHIAMVRANADGTQTLLTMPNHRRIKDSTLLSGSVKSPARWQRLCPKPSPASGAEDNALIGSQMLPNPSGLAPALITR